MSPLRCACRRFARSIAISANLQFDSIRHRHAVLFLVAVSAQFRRYAYIAYSSASIISQMSGSRRSHIPLPARAWMVSRGSICLPEWRHACCACHSYRSVGSAGGVGGTPSNTPNATCLFPSFSMRDPSVAAASVKWWRAWSCTAMCLACHVALAPLLWRTSDSDLSHLIRFPSRSRTPTPQ